MLQFDLASPADGVFPEHWLNAAMPQAQIYRRCEGALISLTSGRSVELSTTLCALLADSAATRTIVTVDRATAACWRLRGLPAAPGCWLVQSVAESRLQLLQTLRTALAHKLASSQQHDLRNPLNALGLQCDLLSRTAKPDATNQALSQAASRVAQMKDRLLDLLERQNSMVSLWLAKPQAEHPAIDLTAVTTEVLRLLRSYASQHEVTIHAENLAKLDSTVSSHSSIPIRLAMIAAGVLAIESNVHGSSEETEAQVSIELVSTPGVRPDSPSACLKIQSEWISSALAPEMPFVDIEEWFHSLALLVNDECVEISRPSTGEIWFRFGDALSKQNESGYSTMSKS